MFRCHIKYFRSFSGLEMNGTSKFCALWSCGCVLSERALKEVVSETCHCCGSPFEKDDVIIIYPEDDDLALLTTNMKIRKEKLKASRKDKKLKKAKRKLEESETPGTSTEIKDGGTCVPSSSSSKKTNGDHFVIPKVPKIPNDVKKAATVAAGSSKKDKKDKVGKGEEGEKGEKEPLIDPKASKVYKSLFTSGQEKQSADKTAHWITYNPYHL